MPRSSEIEPSKIARSLWPELDRPRRGPKPRMSLDSIVAAAIAVADAEGLGSVSMQRIADELGATKMSLYRYTPGKAELTAVMLDTAIGARPDLTTFGGDWRAGLKAWAAALRDAMVLHPWALELAVGARVLGPNELDWTEAGLLALATTPLTGGERLDALALITAHVRGMIQQSIGPDGITLRPEHGADMLMADILASHAGRYPAVAAAFADARANHAQDNADRFGLERILDGLEVAMGERRRTSSG